MARFDKDRLIWVQVKETNDDLIESVRLLRNSGDKFSVEAPRLSKGNEK